MTYENARELADKVDYEGGILEAICGYGIPANELPGDTPTEVVVAWMKLYLEVPGLVEIIRDWLPEPGV